jgi:hypothetical protein
MRFWHQPAQAEVIIHSEVQSDAIRFDASRAVMVVSADVTDRHIERALSALLELNKRREEQRAGKRRDL